MSPKGLQHRSSRAIEPEAVFGQVKSNNKFNRFTMRGLDKTGLEFGLMAIGHNLRKLAARKDADKNTAPKNKLTREKAFAIIAFTLTPTDYYRATA